MIVPARTHDEKSTLVAYIASKIGVAPLAIVGQMPFEVVATVANGRPTGAVIYTNYRETSIEMACAGEPGWLTRDHLRQLFAYPFLQLGCFTITTMVQRRNERARKFNDKLGFIHLGVIESGTGKGDDTILYKMTRPQCRWIEPQPSNVLKFPDRPSVANGVEAHG